MKKPINLFNRVLVALVLCAGLVVTGCYDDSALLGQIGELDSRVTELERLTAQQNTNIESLQTIVSALQKRDYVTNVAPIKEGETVIGYTITFSESGDVTIYNGSNGVDGQPGKDGYVPVLGVKQDESDGQWYWTIDGKWMTDSNGNKVRASAIDGDKGETGVTPQLKIVDGYWYVSYDGGKTWEEETLGQATGDKGYTMFTEVSYDDDYLYITMADGTKLTLPRASSNQGEGGDGDTNQVGPVAMELSELTVATVTFTGIVTDVEAIPYIEKIAVYYKDASETFSIISARSASTTEINSDNTVSITIPRISYDYECYKYCLYIKSYGVETYSDVKEFSFPSAVKDLNVSSATDLSSPESANCYIVSQPGTYKFKTVKGNSTESVGGVSSCEILWESFGTSTTPDYCSLISGICYKDNYIAFEAPSTFTEGNAVLAAKDADGNILWSWHIWLTDKPAEHVYNNNAGTMMDRNLGATSTTPGDVGALGLLYQWGRKDPFLNSSQIEDYEGEYTAKSTLTWPEAVESTSSTGTIDYVTSNPTTFVTRNNTTFDWYYSDVKYETDDTRWQSEKTIYDPCPPGWRVPDGGSSGVWSTAGFADTTYDRTNKGISFSISSPSTTWYPASGYRNDYDGGLYDVGSLGYYWSVTPSSNYAYNLSFYKDGDVNPSNNDYRADGYAVRCLQE